MKTLQKITLIALMLSASLTAAAADYTIQSKILDKDTEAGIEMATVRLLAAKDSSFVVGAVSDQYGDFMLKKVKNGKYILEIKYLGYDNHYQNLQVQGKSLMLKNILLQESTQHLDAVSVSGMAAQMLVKVDTIEFNAAAFKTTENAVVEDLLKRLPGVEVNDGSITINGETISRIKVDGKKFFDGDIEMTTKNLTADMVEKIQVIDEKSDMAKLTGFEDDQTERIINITLKKNRKKGIFGNVKGGLGADMTQIGEKADGMDMGAYAKNYDWGKFFNNDARYDANAFINFMLGESQTAVVGGANNINSSRSGRGRGNRGWGGGGVTQTQNVGINNNTQISENLLVGGDLSYNHSSNFSESESTRDSWLAEDTLTNNNRSTSRGNSDNSNIRLEMEWKIDSMNTLVVQPSISFSHNENVRQSEYDYYTNGDSTSWGNSHNNSVSDNTNARLNLIYSHKSRAKRGRTFTVNLGGNMSESLSTGHNLSNKFTRTETQIIDQETLNTSDSYGFNFRGSFVEPLWNMKNFMELSGSFNYSERTSEKSQYDDTDADGIYDVLDTEYSNNYLNRSMSEVLEAKYRYNDGVVNMTAGFRLQPSQNYSHTQYMDGNDPYITEQQVVNFSPSLSLRYNFGDRRNFIRMEYRGNSSQPSIQQMQPVKNNNDLMNETVGNATLLPSYSQNLRFIITKFNPVTFASWNATITGSMTQNALVSNSIYDATGKRYNQTVNALKNPFNFNGSFMFNAPIIENRLHFNTRTSLNYQERFGYTSRLQDLNIDINNMPLGAESRTQNYGVNENISLTFTHDVIEIGARGNYSYGHTHNFLSNSSQNTMNWSGSGNINLHLPYSINIASDISYSDRKGYSNFDQSEIMWNATIDKSFGKKLTLQLRMTDILRQRLNISQTIGDNYMSFQKYNTLPSYFILTVTYKISKFGGNMRGAQMPDNGGEGRRGAQNMPSGFTPRGLGGNIPMMGM
ncbi:MAG: outer membrane beta-barrel protein [Bacteroidales bacterium]|nr:outer membrane beta-barrel protein [Bacteroidales bacterium]